MNVKTQLYLPTQSVSNTDKAVWSRVLLPPGVSAHDFISFFSLSSIITAFYCHVHQNTNSAVHITQPRIYYTAVVVRVVFFFSFSRRYRQRYRRRASGFHRFHWPTKSITHNNAFFTRDHWRFRSYFTKRRGAVSRDF